MNLEHENEKSVAVLFISGCLVREKPVPGQKLQGENGADLIDGPSINFYLLTLFSASSDAAEAHLATLKKMQAEMPSPARCVSPGA